MMYENAASLNQSINGANAEERLLSDTQLTPLSAAEKGNTGGVAALSSRQTPSAAGDSGSSTVDDELRFEAWLQHALLV